ncbi:uncharacterized protein FYW49_000489 [Xenentodon cancila]
MNELGNIDNLLFQLALQTRELSQRKNEINEQIKVLHFKITILAKVCRASIADRRSYIEMMHRNIKKLDEEIGVKQRTAKHNKENAKSMKGTTSLVLHYEQILKAELDTRKENYNHDSVVYEERISSYQKTFQSHKECYLENPLAQKLLMLQTEKEEIEKRIRACDDQITVKQAELDRLTGPAVNPSSTEKLPESVFGHSPITEQEKQSEHQANEDSDSSIDLSSLHLKQTTVLRYIHNDPKTLDVNADKTEDQNKFQDLPTYNTFHENIDTELCSYSQSNEQSKPDEVNTEEQNQETSPEDQEQQPIVSGVEDVVEDEIQGGAPQDEEKAAAEDHNQRDAILPLASSQEANPQSVPEKTIAVPSTPTFTFSFSPPSSPSRGTPGTKSPAFLFSLNANVSTPGFTGFGFDASSSQDEESSFAFAGSLFHEKVCFAGPEFLFGQPELSEDFHFAFTAKSPQSCGKENTKDDFPFSFNF